jgi:hypothetical protein
MMQATDLSNGDHLSDPALHDWARVRTILVERKTRPGSMVVLTKNSVCTGIAARIAIELIRASETGSDLNHKRSTADRDRKPPDE